MTFMACLNPLNMKNYILYSLPLFFLALTQCTDDPIPNESELITTVNLYFQSVDLKDSVKLSFFDPDGDGGISGTYAQSKAFLNNTHYNLDIELLNESETPVENITEEIHDEKEAHQFFFIPQDTSLLNFQYRDFDANGDPVGLKMLMQTKGKGNASFQLILRHEPDKKAPGVISGSPTNAGGETDIELHFSGIAIQ